MVFWRVYITIEYNRLQQLEEIANNFKGVEKSFAIQAGREIRIIVKPEIINDDDALFLAKDIARKVEKEIYYSINKSQRMTLFNKQEYILLDNFKNVTQ